MFEHNKKIGVIRKILDLLKKELTEDNVNDIEDLLEHGEWGEALDVSGLFPFEIAFRPLIPRDANPGT